MPLTTGARFGGYEIVGALGAGGMGEVYRARDTKLAREVAIKILPSAFTQDPDRLARFEREARVLASLNHPNIATIHGIEEVDGIRGLVLELVEGETLPAKLAAGEAFVGSSPIALFNACGAAVIEQHRYDVAADGARSLWLCPAPRNAPSLVTVSIQGLPNSKRED